MGELTMREWQERDIVMQKSTGGAFADQAYLIRLIGNDGGILLDTKEITKWIDSDILRNLTIEAKQARGI